MSVDTARLARMSDPDLNPHFRRSWSLPEDQPRAGGRDAGRPVPGRATEHELLIARVFGTEAAQ